MTTRTLKERTSRKVAIPSSDERAIERVSNPYLSRRPTNTTNLHNISYSWSLELHIMRTVTLAESELLVKVLLEHGDLLHALDEGSIHSLLVGLALLRDHGLRVTSDSDTYHVLLGEEFGGLHGGGLEVGVVHSGRDLHAGDIDLGGGGNDVSLVHTAERHLVHLVGSYTSRKQR